MHNLSTVIIFELMRTIKKKSFWISALALPVVISIVFVLSFVSSKSASENEQLVNSEKFSVVVLDESGLINQAALASVEAQTVADKNTGQQLVKEGGIDAFIYYPEDPVNQVVEIYGQDVGITKNGKYTNLASNLLKTSVVDSLDSPIEALILQGEPNTKFVAFDNGVEAQGIEQVIVPGVFLVLFYLVIILLGNHMLTSTTEEKENRVIEIILSSVDAGSLIVGKIFAMVIAGILQMAVISIPVIIGLLFFRDKINIPQVNLSELVIDPIRLLVGLSLFIFSFLLFTGLLVTIGAIVPTAKEAGSFFGVAMFFTFIPLYAAAAIVTNPSQLIVKVFSFFPLTAPITLMLRNAVGNLSPIEATLGITIIGISSLIALFIAIRAFRYGTLEYNHRLNLRRVLKDYFSKKV